MFSIFFRRTSSRAGSTRAPPHTIGFIAAASYAWRKIRERKECRGIEILCNSWPNVQNTRRWLYPSSGRAKSNHSQNYFVLLIRVSLGRSRVILLTTSLCLFLHEVVHDG